MIRLSVLDLSPIAQGSTAAHSFRNSLSLAQHAEQWGYARYWLAEHHGMPGIASAATAVLLAHIGGGTSRLRIGAGGIMLPNHSPLVIAEQFGTLESLFPGRIDLGLGRAPGTDQVTARAMRRDPAAGEEFPQDVMELQALFAPVQPGQPYRAVPGAGLNIPLWILGSSLYGAHVAAALGLPYAFASHFAPDALHHALQVYRERFKPSAQLDRPYAMPCVNIITADTDDEARYLFTTAQQNFTRMIRNTRGQMPPPIENIDAFWSPAEKAQAMRMLSCSFVGSPDTVRAGLDKFIEQTGADELIVSGPIYDHAARLRSFEIAAALSAELGSPQAVAA